MTQDSETLNECTLSDGRPRLAWERQVTKLHRVSTKETKKLLLERLTNFNHGRLGYNISMDLVLMAITVSNTRRVGVLPCFFEQSIYSTMINSHKPPIKNRIHTAILYPSRSVVSASASAIQHRQVRLQIRIEETKKLFDDQLVEIREAREDINRLHDPFSRLPYELTSYIFCLTLPDLRLDQGASTEPFDWDRE